jgi:hypothetical protein
LIQSLHRPHWKELLVTLDNVIRATDVYFGIHRSGLIRDSQEPNNLEKATFHPHLIIHHSFAELFKVIFSWNNKFRSVLKDTFIFGNVYLI